MLVLGTIVMASGVASGAVVVNPSKTATSTSNFSTSTTNTFSVPQNFTGINNTGNVTSTTETISGSSTAATYTATGSSTAGSFTASGNATATISGNANTVSYFPVVTGGVNLPSPTQLAAPGGITCGTTSGVSDGILCLNDIYAANAGISSSTLVNVGNYTYNSTNTIKINTLNERMTVQCAQGGGTIFHQTATGTVPFLQLNTGAAGNAGALNIHPGTYGFFGCELQGPGNTTVATTTIGLQFGGSNGSEGATFAYGKIDGFGIGVSYASSSWRTSLLYDDISSNYVNWNFPNGLTNTGEAVVADHINFHDSTQQATTANGGNYQNCVTPQGGGYFDFEFDNFDDCQFKFTGSGVVRFIDYYEENPGSDANGASYIPLVNGSGNLAAVMEVINPFFTQDGSTASGTPPEFVVNSSTLFMTNAVVFRNSASGTVQTFFQNNGSGAYQITGAFGEPTPWNFFINGTDNNQIRNNSGNLILIGTAEAVDGNWNTGWSEIGNNIIALDNGGFNQILNQPSGTTFINSNSTGITANSSTIDIYGSLTLHTTQSSITTGAIGGGSLTAGTCASTTTALPAGISTSSAIFPTQPNGDPGPDFYYQTVLIASSSVSTRVCAAGITGTPTSMTYRFKIIQ